MTEPTAEEQAAIKAEQQAEYEAQQAAQSDRFPVFGEEEGNEEPEGTHSQDEGEPETDKQEPSDDGEAPSNEGEGDTRTLPQILPMLPGRDGQFTAAQVGQMLQSIVGLLEKQQREIAEIKKRVDDAVSFAKSSDTQMDGLLALLEGATQALRGESNVRTNPEAGS